MSEGVEKVAIFGQYLPFLWNSERQDQGCYWLITNRKSHVHAFNWHLSHWPWLTLNVCFMEPTTRGNEWCSPWSGLYSFFHSQEFPGDVWLSKLENDASVIVFSEPADSCRVYIADDLVYMNDVERLVSPTFHDVVAYCYCVWIMLRSPWGPTSTIEATLG